MSLPDSFQPPVLTIGLGNPLRGDDAAGWRVAETVATWRRPGVRVLTVRQLTPEITVELIETATLIVVDASVESRDTVTIRPAPISASSGRLTHATRIDELLQLCRILSGRAPDAWLVGLPARCFELGGELSPECRKHMDHALAALAQRLP
jgi:hydrogenase maturation protease